jgi:hypothetical protein
MIRRAVFVVVLALASCQCGAPSLDMMSVCVDAESFDALQSHVASGPIVDEGAFPDDAESGRCTVEDALAHAVVIDAGEIGMLRFRWGQDGVDLATDLVNALDATFTGPTFNGGFSFVLSDDIGLAVAAQSQSGLPEVPGIRIEHGDWRGTHLTGCGSETTRSIAVTVDNATTQVEVGESISVEAAGLHYTFHAFASATLDDSWRCTDGFDPLSWALVRD